MAGHLNDWYRDHGQLVRARTYRNATTMAPAWVRANQTWWFTHDRLRKAYRLLERLSQAGTLFTYLRHEFTGLDIAATTNRIEGGTNAQLRLILRAHRGMSEEHQKRAIEWYLYLHSESPVPPARLIRPEHHTPTRTPAQTAVEQPDGPEEYGNASHRRGRPLGPRRMGRTPVTRPAFTHVLSYNPCTCHRGRSANRPTKKPRRFRGYPERRGFLWWVLPGSNR